MKLTKEQFKQFILEEVKKIAVEEGWIAASNEKPVVVSENDKTAVDAPAQVIADASIPEVKEEPKIEIAEVKRLAEEFSRMKALVDFRRPLLSDDNQ